MSSTDRRRLAVLPALLLLASAAVAAAERPPDVLLISIDTLRPDVLGAYGDETARTPAIDGLARRGRLYRNATTPFPRTTPAVASLLTGLWPQHHGSRELSEPIHDVPTLAGRLAERGYLTLGISSTAVLSERENLDRGFSAFVSERLPAGAITERALRSIAAVPADRPLFLWVHYFDPHFPYAPWHEWPRQPAAESCRRLDHDFREQRSLSYIELHGDAGGRASAALADCRTLYAEEVAYTDHAIGRLLAGWGEARDAARTVTVLTADHGEHFGEDGLWYDHGPSLHDAGLRVPLVIAGPGVPRGDVDDVPARLEDVTPTVLSLVGVPASERGMLDGVDLLLPAGERPSAGFAESGTPFDPRFSAWLASGRAGGVHCVHRRPWSLCLSPGTGEARLFDNTADPLFHTDVSGQHGEVARAMADLFETWPVETARRRAVRTRHYKLVEYPRDDGGYRRELYDLRRDPDERVDRAADLPVIVERLGALLDAWTADIPARVAPAERDDERLEILRSLGYIE